MNEYNNPRNVNTIKKATNKMLNDKFSLSLKNEDLDDLVLDMIYVITNDIKYKELSVQELNKLTLTKIKEIYDNIPDIPDMTDIPDKKQSNVSDHITKEKIDEDILNSRLKELEIKRSIIPVFETIDDKNMNEDNNYMNMVYKNKTLIINSLNRDWEQYKKRNGLKVNFPLETGGKYVIIPHKICFPNFVKMLTPYVLMHITDGTNNQYYSFTCCDNTNNKWNIWETVDSPENISLSKQSWSVTFLDFTNAELNLGYDDILIISIMKDDDLKDNNIYNIKLNYDGDLNKNDIICIKLKNGQKLMKTVMGFSANIIKVYLDKNEISLLNYFNGGRVLNTGKQYSVILKYFTK